MRQLLPTRSEAEATVEAIYADIAQRATVRKPSSYVAVNMVSSADGAITLEGLSGGLSGSADKEVFFYLRSLADVILVGAGTVRAENYGRPRLADDRIRERERRGQQPLPRIAVVSKSLRMNWSGRLFSESRPYVICPAKAPPDQLEAAREVADVIIAGDEEVDLKLALETLTSDGRNIVLCEGGPTLNGELFDADVVDELCLTLSPGLVGGVGKRLSGWMAAHPALPLQLLTVAEDNGVLFLRYALKDALQD